PRCERTCPYRTRRPQSGVLQIDDQAPPARAALTKGVPLATIHRGGNVDLLSGKVAVIGYGSQGHAHALNLRDSGVEVEVGLRAGSPSADAAEDAGLAVGTVGDATRGAQVVAILVPDHVQKGVYEQEVEPNLEPDAALLFAHGLNVHFGRIGLVKAGFETLVEAGYQPEIAYYECLNELKLIVDLIYEGGFEYMRYSISDVAEYGDLTRGPRIVDERVKETMRTLLDEIRSGAFARELFADDEAGRPRFEELRRQNAGGQLEQVGSELRALAGKEGLLGADVHGVG